MEDQQVRSPLLPEMPDFDPEASAPRADHRVRSRWVELWKSYVEVEPSPRQCAYLASTCAGIWSAGLDPDSVLLEVLTNWDEFVEAALLTQRVQKYTADELRDPHIDFFAANWKTVFAR